ncbi:MAG TPA: hypothetical protein VFZ61_25650 [Polyangiales bacterium]
MFIDGEKLVFAVAADLKGRRMEEEVQFLRRLYGARRRHPQAWRSDDLRLIELACMVGIAPFDGVFIAQPRHYRCACWGKDRDRGRTQCKSFGPSSIAPALTVHWCRACSAHWVVSEDV